MRKGTAHTAKITRPSLTGIFPRRRLFRLLKGAHDKSVIWITGPAGSGKTTLGASYLDFRKLPCLWYQTDSDDADIFTFFYYLGLAAKHAAPRYRTPLPLLTPEYLQAIPTFTRRYFEKFYARLKPPFALVFDNFQDVPPDSAFHDVIREAVSILPKGISIFLISRGDPPPSFARLRANNRILVIDWSEMRLTLDEAGELVKKQGRVSLPKELISQFHARTDGWAAGLVLLTEAYKARGINVQRPGISAPQEIFDYFAGELLDKLDSETRDFLLITSILPTMTAETADQLTGRENAGRILSSLNRNHFFIAKHTSGTPTYQYHPLFREFLLSLMKESLSPEGVLQIQNRAAAILAEAGRIEDAATLYRDAKNWVKFIPLILGCARSLAIQGRGHTLQGWIGSLPKHYTDHEPWLLFWRGVCFLPFSPAESKNDFEKAFGLFKARKDPAGKFLSLSAMFDSVAFSFDSFTEYDRLIHVLYELRRKFPGYPSPEIEAGMTAAMLFALYARQPKHPDYDYWVARGRAALQSILDVDTSARILLMLALKASYDGELEKMGQMLDTFRETMAARAITPTAMVMLKVLEVNYSWLTAEFGKHRKATDEGIAFVDTTGVHTLDVFISGNGAAGALSTGEMRRADDLLKRMRSCLDKRAAAWGESFYHELAAWKCLLHGDLQRASVHADQAVKFGVESGGVPYEAYHYLIKAIVEHELKREPEASSHLSKVQRICSTMKTCLAEFTYLLAEARFAFDRGDETSGTEFLRKAMALGQKHGYMNTFFWIPSVMARLCVKALEAGIEVEYVRDLVRRRNLIPDTPPVECENWPWPVKIFTLGRFGIERNGKPVRFSKKVPRKPMEMLKVLIALGGQSVPEARLNDILWPDADGDSAHRAFNITLIRLRELLGPKEAVELRDGCVTLDKRYVWADAWALEHMIEETSNAQRSATFTPETFDQAAGLYRGPFLVDENGGWAISRRERLRGMIMHHVERLGRIWEEKKMFLKAIDCYRNGLEIDDLAEEFYRRAILCFLKLDRKAEALSLYRRCEKILGSYGIRPSSDTETIFKSLISR